MIVTTDPIGEWYQLGFIKPMNYNQWYELTPEHDVHSGRYRLTFTSDRFAQVRSYSWVRSVYVKDGVEIYSQSRRVYPHPLSLDIAMPIPADYRAQGVERQRLQLKKLLHPRRSTDYIWSVRIEELYVELGASDNTFFITLTNIVSSRRNLDDPELWDTVFEEETGYSAYEVGRFYTADASNVLSDPVVETYPNRLVSKFTSRQPIQPGTIKVRLVA